MATDYVFHNAAHVRARNPFAVLGLGIITLGIYQLYWWYAVNREMRDASSGTVPVNPLVSLLAVTFGAVLLVPPFVSFHKTGRRAQAMARVAGRGEELNMWLYWLLLLFTSGTGAYIYMQWELNKVWTAMQASGAAPVPDAPAAAPERTGPFM